MNRILFFSGGLSSFAVAHHLKTTYPNDNILLYFTDTLWEDEDLYRFIQEVSDKLELPMLKQSVGIDPVQLMIKQHIIFNSRMGNCSQVLKMKVAADFLKKGIAPITNEWVNKKYLKSDEFVEDAILYFGISFDEYHRTKAIAFNWKPFNVEFPLCKIFYDYDLLLKQYGIEKPQMYLKGFTHNNCKGRCVKAGKGHYKLLYNEDRETFDEITAIEHMLSLYVGAYHLMKEDPMAEELLKENEQAMNIWHDSNYQIQPNLHFLQSENSPTILKNENLKSIKRQLKQKCQLDLFDEIGGCGCFVDYDEQGE